MSENDCAREVRTSITVGMRAVSASRNAGPSASGSVTRTPLQPMARAIAAWSKSPNSAANGPPPCSTQPSARLLNTTLMIGMSCSMRGHQAVHRHREPAVAAHRDDRPIRVHKLRRERGGDREPHGT